MTSASIAGSRVGSAISRMAVIALLAGCGRTSTEPLSITSVPALTAQNSTVGAPVGWHVFLGQPTSFAIGTETASAHGGTTAAFLMNATPTPPDTTFSTIDQFVQVGAFAGHRVRLSAWLRPVNVTLDTLTNGKPAGVSGLWMRIDGYGLELGFDNMDARPVVGTTGWQHVSVVLDVPTYAIGIGFGALFSGRGELLVDDVVLETVGTSTPTTNMLSGEVPVPGDPEATVATYAREPAAPVNLDFESAARAVAARRAP